MRRTVTLATGLVLLGMLATPGQAQEEEAKKKIRRHPDVISAEEIAERNDLQTAGDAVRRLRPAFLRVRASGGPASTAEPIRVYVDGIMVGEVSALTQIQVSIVKEIRKLSSSDATTRFGTGHTAGAILVTTIHAKGPPDS